MSGACASLKSMPEKLENFAVSWLCRICLPPDGLLNAWRKQGNKATVMRRVTGMMDEHYPGIMEKVLLVNAPWALHALIKVVTPLLPPRIVQKIQFVPVDQTPTRLLEFICPEKLPSFLGGNAENEEFVPARAAALLARPGTEVFIKAGCIEECSLSLEANDEATCSVFVEGGLDIMLDCCFVDGEGKEEIVPPARVIEKDFNFTAMKKGELMLRFDNTYSRVKPKTIKYELAKLPDEVQRADGDAGYAGWGMPWSISKIAKHYMLQHTVTVVSWSGFCAVCWLRFIKWFCQSKDVLRV